MTGSHALIVLVMRKGFPSDWWFKRGRRPHDQRRTGQRPASGETGRGRWDGRTDGQSLGGWVGSCGPPLSGSGGSGELGSGLVGPCGSVVMTTIYLASERI